MIKALINHDLIDIIVLGEAMIELSEVTSDRARIGVAGDCFNVSVYMARAGLSVKLASAVGDDPMSKRLVDAFKKEGIDTSLVLQTRGKAPGLYAVNLDPDGERDFTYWRENSAARTFFQHDTIEAVTRTISRASHLYLSGITLSIFAGSHLDTLINLVATASASGCKVIFDTNYRPSGWQSIEKAQSGVLGIRPYVSIALPTFEDEAALFGFKSVEQCAKFWRDAGCEEVVVKSGPQGAYTLDDGWIAPAKTIKPTDTTGAGDSFNGAYLAARLRGTPVVQSVHLAHRLAGQVIQVPGAILPQSSQRL